MSKLGVTAAISLACLVSMLPAAAQVADDEQCLLYQGDQGLACYDRDTWDVCPAQGGPCIQTDYHHIGIDGFVRQLVGAYWFIHCVLDRACP